MYCYYCHIFFFLLIFSSLNGKWLWFIACSFWSVEVKRFSRSKVTCWSLHWSLPYPLFSSFASCLHDVASCLSECDWEKKERKKMLFWLIWAISDFCFNRESWHYCFDVYCLVFFFFCHWETVVLSWHFFQLFTMPSPYGQLYIIALKKKSMWWCKCWNCFHLTVTIDGMKNEIWKILFFPTVVKYMQLWRC